MSLPAFDDGIPIVIGVTGHRDTRGASGLEAKVTDFITGCLEAYPNSPLVIMTGLAEGADRAVATAVAGMHAGYRKRIRLLGVLPLPEQEYRWDWADNGDSDQAFTRLLGECDDWFELPLSWQAEREVALLHELAAEREVGRQFDQGSLRNKRYALVGSYIARHSHVLLAIWDGGEERHEGGTRWVIEDFEQGCGLTEYRKEFTGSSHEDVLIPDAGTLRNGGLGSVYHIPCPRSGDSDARGPEQSAGDWRNGAGYPAYLGDIEAFNARSKAPQVEGPYKRAMHHFGLGLGAENHRKLAPYERQAIERLTHVHAMADGMAIDVQQQSFGRFVFLSLLALLAVCCFLADDQLGVSLWVTVAFFVFAGATLGFRKRFSSKGEHLLHLQYRSLAEGLRTQIAWLSAGLQSSVIDGYPYKYVTELGWVTHALRGLHAGVRTDPQSSLSKTRIAHVGKHWVSDQKNFIHQKKSTFSIRGPDRMKGGYMPRLQGYEPMLVWLERIARLLAGISYVAAAWKMASGFPHFGAWLPVPSHALNWFLIVMPLSVSLVIRRYIEGMGLHEELKWYEAVCDAYEQTEALLEANSEHREMCAQALLKLGANVLHENAAWVDLHRRNELFAAIDVKD